jgi:hypothetical protein
MADNSRQRERRDSMSGRRCDDAGRGLEHKFCSGLLRRIEGQYLEYITLPATVLLILSTAGGGMDLIYFHLYKYKLYRRKDMLYEHKLHTAQIALGSMTVFFLFCNNFGGVLLWCGICVIFIGLVVEVMDIISEKKSRASVGGLSSFEYAIHVMVSALRAAFIALMLSIKPSESWSLSSNFILNEKYSIITYGIGWIVFFSGILLTILHLWLIQQKYRTTEY